jgi:hypothetical protein
VKDAFRVGRDRRKVILEEAGTWASCVPDLTFFKFLFIYLFYFNFIFFYFFYLLLI